MVFFKDESVKNLWHTWNIRVLLIVSLLLQYFLVLFAPLRKKKVGNFVVTWIWLAYLLADWVATFTIGLILRAERSDILVFWAPFLLLHLGGPDNITSFSLEDNEFWVRHLVGLVLQIGSTIYVILQSLPQNKLLLPTFLVLIAGTIKYAERNRAFYLACFDHFGDNWRSDHWIFRDSPYGSFPNQFINIFRDETMAVFGILKSLLVGPRRGLIKRSFVLSKISHLNSDEVLQSIEISLSLLYGVLHTKLPVVDSKTGHFCRVVNMSCILGALFAFSILKKHYKLGEFDEWMTYWLLLGALAMDLISIIFLILLSDWILFSHYSWMKSKKLVNRPKRRWSNSVPQLNFITYHLKDYPDWFKILVDFFCIKSLFNVIRRIQYSSFEPFRADQEWHFIFTELKGQKIPTAGNAPEMGKEIHPNSYDGILQGNNNLDWSIKDFGYVESLVIWHIATEICYVEGDPDNRPCSASPSTERVIDHRKICKLLSDYLFYLAIVEPTMVGTMSTDLQIIFQRLSSQARTYCVDHKISNEKDFSKGIHSYMEGLPGREIARNSDILCAASELAKVLEQQGSFQWQLMSKVWVKFVCYAAFNCKPIIHARQVSRGGQLLTLVWFLMNIFALTPPNEWQA